MKRKVVVVAMREEVHPDVHIVGACPQRSRNSLSTTRISTAPPLEDRHGPSVADGPACRFERHRCFWQTGKRQHNSMRP